MHWTSLSFIRTLAIVIDTSGTDSGLADPIRSIKLWYSAIALEVVTMAVTQSVITDDESRYRKRSVTVVYTILGISTDSPIPVGIVHVYIWPYLYKYSYRYY